MKTKDESPKETKTKRPSRSSSTDQTLPTKQSKLDDSNGTTDNKVKVKHVIDNLDVAIIQYEEDQSTQRDSYEDLEEFKETCQNISECVSQINQMKAHGKGREDSSLMKKRKEAMLLTTNLRKLNRYAQIRERKAKESTIAAKNKVDALHLDLQNLLYEMMHMKKEIQKCMNFSSRDEEIDLVDVDEFYKDAPESISKPTSTKTDAHSQMLARLDWELHQRKELSLQKSNLIEDKKSHQKEIAQKTEYLRSLKPRLEDIVKATKPVQEHMNLPLGAEKMLFETAQYLPRPLYVLYIQVKAFKDACDKNMVVDISGDVGEAKTEFQVDYIQSDNESENEGDETIEVIDVDAENESRNKRSKKKKEKSRSEDKKNKILKRHPLSVDIKISSKDEFDLSLHFFYFPVLHICTVEVDIKFSDKLKVEQNSELLSSETILCDLLSSDSGKSSPNPANNYQLEKHSLNPFSSYLNEIGHPYYWVQWICGLNYLPHHDITSYAPTSSLSSKHFQSVLKAIKHRIKARISLQSQLQQLELLTIPEDGNSSCKIVCHLTSWKRIFFEDLQHVRFMELEEFGLLNESCVIYEAVLTREESVQATIAVHSDYPNTPPLMVLATQDNKVLADWSMFLRGLECEVNAYTEELIESGNTNLLLAKMLRKLQICFDIFLETGGDHSAKDKLYTRKTRGRDRSRPYKQHIDGYFTHR